MKTPKDYLNSPLTYVDEYLRAIGLKPGIDTAVRVNRATTWFDQTTTEASVEVEVDFKKLDAATRRQVKRAVKLEVPEWAKEWHSKPLNGMLKIETENDDGTAFILTYHFSVNGAFICEAAGTTLKPATTHDLNRAQELLAMSDEQILAAHKQKVLELTAPKEVTTYTCKPA